MFFSVKFQISKNTNTAKKNFLNFYIYEDKINHLNSLWVTCYEPINNFDCSSNFNSKLGYKKADNIKYHLIKSTLYTK